MHKNKNQPELETRIAAVRESLDAARCDFRDAKEPELIDASVYRIKYLQSLYAYLLAQARESGVSIRADGG